ncbi:MAG: ABC transporter substrate-binding protein, partial [Candidatus Atribacteria bacterium]|nr:ABC transporter substrate-binding protein [Candidatus Atribacteria bacterium]
TVIDDTGTAVTIPQEPQRIISTAPSNTEILFDLGLQEKIVGITNYCNFPEETKKIEKIGEISPLNFEKIIYLNPDLILAYAGFQLKEIPRLRELGLNAIVLEPLTLEDTFKSVEMIANVCGISDKGSLLVDNLIQRVNIIKSKVSKIPISARPKIFVGGTSETIFTPGAGTLFNELITLAGGQNIAAGLTFWKQISPEFVAQAEPDIIIIPVGVMNPGEESKIKSDISQRSGWSNIPAIKNQKIFIVNEDLFYRAVPRLVDGLELLYGIFYE